MQASAADQNENGVEKMNDQTRIDNGSLFERSGGLTKESCTTEVNDTMDCERNRRCRWMNDPVRNASRSATTNASQPRNEHEPSHVYSLYRKLSASHPKLILPSFRRAVGRVRRRGYDIVPAGTQIGRESGRLVQRVLRILRGAERLVLALG